MNRVFTLLHRNELRHIPDIWTRVKSRDLMSHERIAAFDIAKDLETDKVLKQVRTGSTK